MKRYYYFIKNYVFDILAALFAIILTGITSFPISIIIIFISLLIIIYLRLRERDFYFIPFDKRQDKDDWIGNGDFEYVRVSKAFKVTDADPGYIYANCLNWSNYKYEFEFKLRDRCLGAILRAVNLSNYVMLQLTSNGIRPHVRINGGWKAWEADQAGLEFSPILLVENWYKCKIVCDKEIVNITILHKNKKLFDREWTIPGGSVVFEFKRDQDDDRPAKIPFPINLEYGSVGFRNSGTEKALVKNVLIEKI